MLHLQDLTSIQDKRLSELQYTLKTIAGIGKASYCLCSVPSAEQSVELYSNNELPGLETFLADLIPADQEKIRRMLQKISSGELSCFSEPVSKLYNNTTRRNMVSASTFIIPESSTRKLLLVTVDISEIENKIQELADADSILKAVFDNLPGHIFLKNISSDFTYVRCNPAYSSLMQMTPTEIVGKNDFDIYERSLAKAIRNCDMNISRTQTLADNRWFFTTPDGKAHAIRFISRPLRRADGTQWILGMGIDVTRQELITGKLRKRNKELRLLMAQLEIPTMLLDNHLNMVCATPALMRQFNPPADSPEPLTCRNLCDCGITDDEHCAACNAMHTKQEQICPLPCNGTVSITIKPLLNEEGFINYLAVTVTPDAGNLPKDEVL